VLAVLVEGHAQELGVEGAGLARAVAEDGLDALLGADGGDGHDPAGLGAGQAAQDHAGDDLA